jgi:predicted PurR-regulated permease PerM
MLTEKKIETQPGSSPSPAWGSTTKLVIGLTLIALVAVLIWRFSSLVTPLLMVFILVYLLYPVAGFVSRVLHISWSGATNIIFLLIIAMLIGSLTLGGMGLLQQIQSLILSIQDIVANLPTYIQSFSGHVYRPLGLFTVDLSKLDLNYLSEQALSHLETILGRTGDVVSLAASSAAEFVGWTLFVLTVSYFLMVESSSASRADLIKVNIPGYTEDIHRITLKLRQIWNAFLRGQIIIFLLALVIYSILLPILGVKYALGIALMAALAKFLPYVGPFVTWVVMGLVTFFQVYKPFDLQPIIYTAIVVGITLLIDQIIDSLIAPRIMANALKVHPAAVLIAALVAASLLGLLGVVIAAPLLATCTLLVRYIMRKMFDLDPWDGEEVYPEPSPYSGLIGHARRFWRTFSLKRNKST